MVYANSLAIKNDGSGVKNREQTKQALCFGAFGVRFCCSPRGLMMSFNSHTLQLPRNNLRVERLGEAFLQIDLH
jgi:hypothetical protein